MMQVYGPKVYVGYASCAGHVYQKQALLIMKLYGEYQAKRRTKGSRTLELPL